MNFVTSMKQLLSKPFFLIYSFVIFALPLIFSRSTEELYEFPKIAFFYTFCILIFALFVSRQFISRRRMLPIPAAVILFLVSFLVSTLFSSHLYTSVFGYYSRFADSLLFYITVLIFYYVALNVFSRRDAEMLFDIAQVGSVILFLFALGQYFPPLRFLWGGQLQERAFSTFGQPNWYAQYLVMLLGISIFEFLFGGRRVYFFFFFVQFFSLWLTFSMSGLAGFVSIVIYFFCSLVSRKVKIQDKRNFGFRVVVIFVVILIIPFLFPGIFKERIKDVITDIKRVAERNFFVYARQETEKNLISDPGYIRSGLWKGTADMINSDPRIFLLGSGPETFPYYFQKFRPLSLNYSSEWNFVFNKPHNYYLETWAEQGILGLVSYLVLLFFVFRKVDGRYKSTVLGFAVTNFFGWPTVATFVLFWLMVATIGARNEIS